MTTREDAMQAISDALDALDPDGESDDQDLGEPESGDPDLEDGSDDED